MTYRVLGAVIPLAVLLTACELSKSSTPLSPSVAGPIPGVEISAPTILEPPSGTKIVNDNQPVTLLIENAWSTGVRPLTLLVEIATDAAFSNTVFAREGLTLGAGGRTTVRLPDPLASERTYFWRARAQDGANTGPYSSAASFNVYTPIVIGEPTLISPAPNSTVGGLRPSFVVANAPRSGPVGPISYLIEVADSDAFTNKIAAWTAAEQASQTTFDLPIDLAHATVYYWHVRAYDSTTTGPFSRNLAFVTPAAPAPVPEPGGGGGSCSPTPTTGQAVIDCVSSQYPDRLAAGVSGSQRLANMEFLRDRIIETGICGGMDLGWNLKRGGPSLSVDAIVWRHGGDETVDIAFAFDDTGIPLQLQWVPVELPFYLAYAPRPSCQ